MSDDPQSPPVAASPAASPRDELESARDWLAKNAGHPAYDEKLDQYAKMYEGLAPGNAEVLFHQDAQGSIKPGAPEPPSAGLPEWVPPPARVLVDSAPEWAAGEARTALTTALQSYTHEDAPEADEAEDLLRAELGHQYERTVADARYALGVLPPEVAAELEAPRPGRQGRLGNSPRVVKALAALGAKLRQGTPTDAMAERWLAAAVARRAR